MIADVDMQNLKARAVSKYILSSPTKVRRVANTVRGMNALEALDLLSLLPQRAALHVYKTVKSAVGNAEENLKLDPENLVISEIKVDEGPRLRRGRYGARGRFKPTKKRLSHITVAVQDNLQSYELDEEEKIGA